MATPKKIEPLVGEELIHKVKELVNLSKEEKAKICGYYSITKNGLERVNMMQFLNALIDAEGINLESTVRDSKHEKRSTNEISVNSNVSLEANRIIAVKPASKPVAKPQLISQPVQKPEEQPEIEQPEQPTPAVHLESLVEPMREESVYGTGWSWAELVNEFSGR